MQCCHFGDSRLGNCNCLLGDILVIQECMKHEVGQNVLDGLGVL